MNLSRTHFIPENETRGGGILAVDVLPNQRIDAQKEGFPLARHIEAFANVLRHFVLLNQLYHVGHHRVNGAFKALFFEGDGIVDPENLNGDKSGEGEHHQRDNESDIGAVNHGGKGPLRVDGIRQYSAVRRVNAAIARRGAPREA